MSRVESVLFDGCTKSHQNFVSSLQFHVMLRVELERPSSSDEMKSTSSTKSTSLSLAAVDLLTAGAGVDLQ